MKQSKAFFASFAALLILLCGCAPIWTQGRSAEEEYLRVYSLVSEGKSFDFETVKNFQVSQRCTMKFERRTQPVEQTALFQYDYKSYNSVKSFSRENRIWFFDETDGYKPQYSVCEYGFQNGEWHESRIDGDYVDHRAFGYASYTAIIEREDLPDPKFRAGSRLLSPDCLENFSGEASGATYAISADVKADSIDAFARWLDALCPFFGFLQTNVDDAPDGVWKWFDPSADYDHRATVSIQTTAYGLAKIDVNFHTYSPMSTGNLGELNVQVRSEYTLGGVSVKTVAV